MLLHGRGASGDDLIGLADVFAGSFPNCAFHSPNAPLAIDGFGYMWWPMDPPGGRGEAVREVEATVNEYLDGLLEEYGLEPSQCVLIGFSQGTVLSLHVAPRRTAPLAGVVGFSGAMVTGDTLEAELASRPPFLLVHGTDDEMLAASESEVAARKLDEAGVPVSLHLLQGLGHGIDQRGLDLATDFMKRVLPAS